MNDWYEVGRLPSESNQKNFTVYFTMETEMTMEKKLRIINRIKKLSSDL